MNAKFYYDRKHKSMFMKQNDYVFFKFYKSYNISSTNFSCKYNQQFVNFFYYEKNKTINLSFNYFESLTNTFDFQRRSIEKMFFVVDEFFQSFTIKLFEFDVCQ